MTAFWHSLCVLESMMSGLPSVDRRSLRGVVSTRNGWNFEIFSKELKTNNPGMPENRSFRNYYLVPLLCVKVYFFRRHHFHSGILIKPRGYRYLFISMYKETALRHVCVGLREGFPARRLSQRVKWSHPTGQPPLGCANASWRKSHSKNRWRRSIFTA